MAYRSSTDDLAYGEDRRPATERWDREKFERYSRRAPEERDAFFYERERDRFSGGRDQRSSGMEERREPDRRNTTRIVLEKDQYYEDDRHERPGRRPDFLNEPTPSEIANQALAPYRRKTVIEREVSPPPRRPQRPQYIRRQSSLDTFDRRPMPRYGDREREEWRPPTNVPIPLPIRERSSRRSSPPRHLYEAEFESHRHRESRPDFREDEVEDLRIRERSSRRKSSTNRRSLSIHKSSRRSSRSSSTSSSDSQSTVRQIGKKGRTRMPKRLAHTSAVIELGLPYEEEDDFIVIQRALEKETIDEVIRISESHRESHKESRTTYVYEDKKVESPPPPPPPMSVVSSHHTSGHHHVPPPPASSISSSSAYSGYPPPPAPHTLYEQHVEESNRIQTPLTTLIVPSRQSRSDREIKDELRQLEEERQLLRYERDGSYDVVVERRPRRRSVVRVEKDRKANPKLLAAMMATLT